MARRRTIDLLPEIFRTDTNRKFLSATLDQLIQEPNLKRTQGYVGRRVGPGVNPADNYVAESTATRSDYQLEPAVTFLQPDTNTVQDAITYPGMLDSLSLAGAITDQEDRLWKSQYYTWDPFCDLDKFSNYSQYYWLPAGPDAVDISVTDVPLTDDFTVTRSTDYYNFSGVAGNNPAITLVRGGNYTFSVNQLGHSFWIQAAPGISGTMPASPNISSRTVLGVENNGEDVGTVTFNVPLKTEQDFYYSLTDIGTVDLITDLKFNQINNIYVSEFLNSNPNGIDGITNLNGRTLVFTNTISDSEDGGWQITTRFDPVPSGSANNGLPGTFDTTAYDQVTDITSQDQRYSVWQISYVLDEEGNPYMQLNSILAIDRLSKFRILFGTQYSNTQWYRNASGFFQEIPLLTAVLDTLYYQDSTNPAIFGQIKLIDADQVQPLDIDEIIGAKNYTSPNGVVFTNGLKVQFRGTTVPAQYQDVEYYVEGVGTGPGIDARVGFINGEAYFGAWHVYQGQKRTGSAYDPTVFQLNIYDTIAESLANPNAGGPAGAPLPSLGQPGAVNGNGIVLLPVRSFITPETYTRSTSIPYDSLGYDVGNYDESLDAPEVPDYLTINRASRDRNPWTRSNRWFHIDVIRYSAELNNVDLVLDNQFRAKRPIIEFRANLRLFNFGTDAKTPVNIVDFDSTDALSNINGQTGYSTDGYTFLDGSLVIFANDSDLQVRNRIYQVNFIDPDGTSSSPLVINLTPIANGEALVNQSVVAMSGVTQQGKSYRFDGSNWVEAQQKTSVNQAPLFDVYDAQGRSLGDASVYPSTSFAGSRLFGYATTNSTIVDDVLGFALRYLNINNVGDIVFDNYFYTDTFTYVQDNTGLTGNVSDGFVRQYVDRIDFSDLIGWQQAITENRSRQVFRFTWQSTALILDVAVDTQDVLPAVQVFVESQYIDPSNYTVTVSGNNTFIDFVTAPAVGSIIEVQALSSQVSQVAFYQVPINLENNALNQNSNDFTLGTIRTQYESIAQNLKTLVGPINGANNSRDLGNILPYGDNIVQHSSPLTLTGTFLRQQQFELFNALQFNSVEYQKYKARLMDLVTKGDFINSTGTAVLDTVMQEISITRTENSPFYWSDMLPSGQTYIENTYVYTVISTPVFDTVQTYNFTESNYQGLLVYLNGEILTLGYDYTVGDGTPTITITASLAVGDTIVIREYPTTYGTYVPNTPTKMGLYPAYRPAKYLDETYVNPTNVIRGHDGSITVAYNDIRDDVLLEFETRIFNNLKISSAIPISVTEVLPGQFRETDYSLAEVNQILITDFLSWVGWNKLDYTTQFYNSSDGFTYNYSQSSNKLNRQPLLGAWRGIYLYFYDTLTPNLTPWEMLGFSQQPTWWENYYGPAPYTSGNLVLWEDLSNGLVRDPAGEYVLPQYVRPDLLSVIPVGSEGQLLNPLDSVVGEYDSTSFRRSWTFGDDGPTESAWRTSSAWPFAVMRLLALTRPAKFFNLFADRDRYVYDQALEQYLWDQRYRLDAGALAPIYGSGTSKASYINWIIDYNQQLGTNSSSTLLTSLSNLDLRLAWRTGAFTDKKYLKIYTERSTPTSLNTSLLLPDESYQILLYKNQPFEQVFYSSVIVQSTDNGWSVLGYNPTQSYFNILVSSPSAGTEVLTAGSESARVATTHTNQIARIPYGYVFTSQAAVCDFLISYGKLLEAQGFTFEGQENGYIMDWRQMAVEFLYWSGQGWAVGSLINLNPAATKISITRPNAVAESIMPPRLDNIVLNQNRQPMSSADLLINRLENTFSISSLTTDTINYLNLRFTAYEHLVVLDNVSIFADLIYQPRTGARQSRVLISGWLSGDWNGTVDAPGFILNQDNIQPWRANQKYTKGQIVLFKDEYWTASTIIQPSAKFDYSLWIKSDYNEIQTGLLPNAANASDQLATAYSVYDSNLETEVDLFSYGLIGFRPRQYMQALNLDDVSQVNLYQQFLGTKGTTRSAELFSLANLGKETAQYDIFEYWAILRNTYGANANRSYFELLLNEAQLPSDPSLVQVILPGEVSQADQTILLENVWNQSYKLPSPNILPTLNAPVTDIALPTAGYVNLDDVDITVFSLTDTTELSLQIDKIGVGTSIWVAKTNPYDWNVYRCQKIPGNITSVSNNLNGLSRVVFDQQHGLTKDDYLIIRYFDPTINGAYIVQSVPDLYSVLIEYTFTGTQPAVAGIGIGFTLETMRVAQPSDISNLDYAKQLTPGARVWVDNGGDNKWTVLEKTDPFTPAPTLNPQFEQAGSQFGYALAQGMNNQTAVVGAPKFNDGVNDIGAAYVYSQNDLGEYEQLARLTLSATDTLGFGNAIDVGNESWAIVGADASNSGRGYAASIYRSPDSNSVALRQMFVAPDLDFAAGQFGHSVAMSFDERWMFIGAPGLNKVYAYQAVDVQTQSVEYVTDGNTTSYNFSNSIVLTSPASSYPEQLNVVLNNVPLIYNTDWTILNGNVVLNSIPEANRVLVISRRSIVQLDQQTYTGVVPAATSGSGTDATFTVNRVRGAFTVVVEDGGTGYAVGDTVTIAGDDIGSGDVTAGSFTVGRSYIITALGTTDFTAIGASSNTVGVIFTATGAGSGSGTAAQNVVLTITQTGAAYSASLVAGLTEFAVSSTSGLTVGQTLVKISGTGDFGSGATIAAVGATTITASVASATSGSVVFYGEPGAISTFTQVGTGVSNTSTFALDPYLATATNIYSFNVIVDDVLQRPEIDYDFNSDSATDSLDLVFNTVPAAGAKIIVDAQSYFQFVSVLEVPTVSATYSSSSGTTLNVSSTAGIVPGMTVRGYGYTQDQYVVEVVSATQLTISAVSDGTPSGTLTFQVHNFGKSVHCTTDGRQIIVGCPGTAKNPGQAFIFDRSVEKFRVVDPAETTYTTVQNLIEPTAVRLNGDYLLDTALNIGGNFTVTGSNTVSVSAPTQVGDIVEIDTNRFTLLQTLESSQPFESSRFGTAVDLCLYDCSLFVGAPNDGAVLPEAGKVEFFQNQSRVFGSTTSTVSNPTLVAGEYLRINNTVVELYSTDINGDAQDPTVESLVNDINNAGNPALLESADPLVRARYKGLTNVVASTSADVVLAGDGTTKVFDVGTVYSSASSYTPRVLVNDVLQTNGVDYTYNNTTRQVTFTIAPINGAVITVVSGRLVLTIKNSSANPPGSKLSVLPVGTNTLFADLGFITYVSIQEIFSPVAQDYAHFGQSLFISDDVSTLAIGAPNGTMIEPTTFDSSTTTFDALSTNFTNPVLNSGVVYIYDALPAVSPTVNNPLKFVFGQQVTSPVAETSSLFGNAIDVTTGILMIGMPKQADSSVSTNLGKVLEYTNASRSPAWSVLRLQQPVVDISLLNTVYMYNWTAPSTKNYFDFFDPTQGKLLGAVRQNLDYIGALDPAAYNVGSINNNGSRWGEAHVGEIWWDTTLARFIDPHQDDIVYASRRWGQLFPGSTVQIYQWVASDVPPSQYAGTPRDTVSYNVNTVIDQQGIVSQVYYFWATDIRTVNREARKTLSVNTIAQYILSPKTSGISYIAPINPSTIGIYNGLNYISAQDTVLYVEFDRIKNDSAVHIEYQLIPQGRADGFLNNELYRKLLDSFSGSDTAGNPVPDPLLSPSEKYGIQIRPRQSMFANRFLALENYLVSANAVMAQYPISESRASPLLNSFEPEPTAGSGQWNLRLATYEELTYQDLNAVALGYKYLVVSDSTNNGLWTIYQVASGSLPGERILELVRVQTYDTRRYWTYIDWYQIGYDRNARIVLEVPTYSSLATITVPEGSSVKVTANAQGKWEIYLLTLGEWVRVALQDGTIAISSEIWDYTVGRFGFDTEVFDAQYYDQDPVTETRKIIEALNQEIFVGDLLIERNRLLTLMFNYILSEQGAPSWLTKTSLIDVQHTIRDLVPFQVYRQDNQDFVLDYIQEVKPYHVQVREFNLVYQGFDQYNGTVVDFDLPAYWDAAQNLFISPVLDNTGTLSTTSSVPSTSALWQTFPYNQWYSNYLLSIESVTVTAGGSGYTVAPTVVVLGDADIPAEMVATINSAGVVTGVTVINPGQGYSTTAVITFEGGNGTGAAAVAIMGNALVRNINTTIKYDRYQYTSTIVEWQANVNYDNGTLVRYDNRVWEASSDDSTGVESTTFDPSQWTLVPAGSLSGVDRTMGYYVPEVNMPGLDLALLISGVDYPGVQVYGPNFNQNTGFDVGNYDINPYDNISYGPEGRPTYDPAILDAIYESSFTDSFLGTLPTSINVDGGEFVDTYSSHAPEELVPGAIFDTLDMRVYTTQGADWLGNDHGFPLSTIRYTFDPAAPELSFAGLLDYPVALVVFNYTQGLELASGIDYTVDWVNYTITIESTVADGETVSITAAALGGGNQIFTNTYVGTSIGNSVVIPREFDTIEEFAIFVNGVQTTDFTSEAYETWNTLITFGTTYGANDRITITALGQNPNGDAFSWSLPLTQVHVCDGSGSFTLTNSLQGTNPINLVVTVNGVRARPSEGVRYIADGSSLQYYLPSRGGYSQSLIANNDVSVYINNSPLVLGVDFVVDPWDGSPRTITLTDLPDAGATILISVRTAAQYWVESNTLTFRPSQGLSPAIGDVALVTTWNDTAEQDLVTEVFVGPESQGIIVSEGYDDTTFDEGDVTGSAGSYDYSAGILVQNNRFDTGVTIDYPERLLVSLDGRFLFYQSDYVVDGSIVEILGPVLAANQVVAITVLAQTVVPEAIAFRIFQDMRGTQLTYRITDNTTTTLAQALGATDDVIYVTDASRLSAPNLAEGIFGLITINGERITYRTRDIGNNTLSGLRRGTAGTGASDHAVGSSVYDIGIGNLLPAEYQNQLKFQNFLGDGTTKTFTTTDITVLGLDSTELIDAVEVYVGGIKQNGGYSIITTDPVSIEFDVAPTNGYQVSIRVLKGLSWYQPGEFTPSNGVPLQETNTLAARFIRGL